MDEKELTRIYWNKELKRRYLAGERDFRGLDQKNLYLSYYCLIDIDLSRANLKESEFTRTSLINAKFIEANLEKAGFNSTLLINANLSNANLSHATLVNADLTGADLTGADLTGADLTDAVLIETNLTDANLTDIKTTEQTIFHQVTMPDGRIQNDLNRAVSAEELLLRYAEGEQNFHNKILHRIDLSGADLRDLSLSNSHASYVNFSGACLENNRGLGKEVIFCDLRNARLSRPEDWLAGRFIYCDLREANLAGLDMSNASFIGSNLLGAKNCLSGGIQEDLFFYQTTWSNGEFIAGPINATSHWRGEIREGEF
ncbi:pentapeptide repeat-containing protein [Microcoleus sp. herbarium14]|uniref:pentapeptide repeat-containing protein n=1 Tax=Microcoleus sp. herbarium14 TaxID=3055439 RepID=UPI002FD494FB